VMTLCSASKNIMMIEFPVYVHCRHGVSMVNCLVSHWPGHALLKASRWTSGVAPGFPPCTPPPFLRVAATPGRCKFLFVEWSCRRRVRVDTALSISCAIHGIASTHSKANLWHSAAESHKLSQPCWRLWLMRHMQARAMFIPHCALKQCNVDNEVCDAGIRRKLRV
jgi:hypothetical protein